MNINELFQQQKALDQRIVKEKGLQGKDLFEDKVIALICELYECVNENRHFKFWSDNKQASKDNLLEEYIDTLHFALSIANDLGHHSHEYIHESEYNLNRLILNLTNIATVLPDDKKTTYIWSLVNQVIRLGYELGFAEEQVIAAYYEKNEINHDRQSNGY